MQLEEIVSYEGYLENIDKPKIFPEKTTVITGYTITGSLYNYSGVL
jgi:hypothetical protein